MLKKLKMSQNCLYLLITLLTSCTYLEKIDLNGEITGTRYSSQQFTKGKHVMSARYPISDTINIKGKVAQPYIGSHSVDIGMPDYGETSVEILF
jgi:hypothetical protein